MTEITGWVLQVLISSRSGKHRLYLTGTWPDGTVQTTSAITTVTADGLAQTIRGSSYFLKGPDRYGKSVAEAIPASDSWIPAGQ